MNKGTDIMAFRTTFKTMAMAEAHANKTLANRAPDSCLLGYAGINVIMYGKNKGRFEINWLIDPVKLLPEDDC